MSGDGGRPTADRAQIERVFRAEFGRCVAALISAFGDIDVAEDAVQEAFVIACRKWPEDGLPTNPGGWITTTARRRALDRLRREARGRVLHRLNAASSSPAESEAEEVESVTDDRLRLIFTCCHPALSTEAQVALTLRLLGGLSTAEVAAAFLISEPTMAQRLVRAKRKIKVARIPYRVPTEPELPARLPPVLAVLYLTYNAGANPASDGTLCVEAIRLARTIGGLLPNEPEVQGLLALLLLTESRRATRLADAGSLVTLGAQDRSGWDHDLISEGCGLVADYARRNRSGIYQLQAAISAIHAESASFEDTDWRRIVALYDRLFALAPTPVVALNRAIAVGEDRGPVVALDVVDSLALSHYQPFHATRADLLRRLGRPLEAAAAYGRAAEMTPPGPERDFLSRGGLTQRTRSLSESRRGWPSVDVEGVDDEGGYR